MTDGKTVQNNPLGSGFASPVRLAAVLSVPVCVKSSRIE
jgi:hypothetical protein